MKESLFQKILRLEKNLTNASVQKSMTSKRRKRKIIPDEYFINVIATIPEKKPVVERSDI